MSTTFSLWSVVIDHDQQGCAFDVTRDDMIGLNHGTHDLMLSFLDTLKLDATPQNWSITPFCSPYYSAEPQANDYLDRYPLTWRVHIDFVGPYQGKPYPYVSGPRPAEGRDTSWTERQGWWRWSEQTCVVIAEGTDERWALAAEDIESEPAFRECRAIESLHLTGHVVQGRFSLGTVRFPDEQQRVDAVVDTCRSRLLWTNWTSSLHA